MHSENRLTIIQFNIFIIKYVYFKRHHTYTHFIMYCIFINFAWRFAGVVLLAQQITDKHISWLNVRKIHTCDQTACVQLEFSPLLFWITNILKYKGFRQNISRQIFWKNGSKRPKRRWQANIKMGLWEACRIPRRIACFDMSGDEPSDSTTRPCVWRAEISLQHILLWVRTFTECQNTFTVSLYWTSPISFYERK
jgi:hypothetical protein